jgi:Family of unknown function (DUF5808)
MRTRRKKTGRFLGMPYDWRRRSERKDTSKPDDSRLLVPKKFGWGYTINLAALKRRRRRAR